MSFSITQALDVEITALYILGTLAFASLTTNASLPHFRKSLKRPGWTPPPLVRLYVWFIVNILAGVAAYLVRKEGGVWVANARALTVFVFLRGFLVLWNVSSPCLFFSQIVLFICLVLSVVCVVMFLQFSVIAAVFVSVETMWLLLMFSLSSAILALNSVRTVAAQQTGSDAIEKGRRDNYASLTG